MAGAGWETSCSRQPMYCVVNAAVSKHTYKALVDALKDIISSLPHNIETEFI